MVLLKRCDGDAAVMKGMKRPALAPENPQPKHPYSMQAEGMLPDFWAPLDSAQMGVCTGPPLANW